ncbi:MAG: hypothetical protein ACRD9R_03845 [Pyrinomonadaceae bacterium]
MKKEIYRTLSRLSLVLVAIVCAAAATQAQTPVHVVAEIPFAFNVGDRVFPAGTYQIDRLLRDSNKALLVRDRDGRMAVSAVTLAVRKGGQQAAAPTLIFRRYGEHYFLAQIFMGGDKDGRELSQSRLERGVARDFKRGRGGEIGGGVRESALVEITGR